MRSYPLEGPAAVTDPTDDLLARADRHRERTTGVGTGFCVVCRGEWPCTTTQLAAEVRALSARLDAAHQANGLLPAALDIIARRVLNEDQEKRFPLRDADGGWWWMDNPDWDDQAEQANDAELAVLDLAKDRP